MENDDVLLIDVRTRRELNTAGQIPKSVNVPANELVSGFGLSRQAFFDRFGFEKPDKNRHDIVRSCASGARATNAEKTLKALGYHHLRIYMGSFTDWKKNGGEFYLPDIDNRQYGPLF